MRYLLLAVLLAGCGVTAQRPQTCIDDDALAMYVSVETAVRADNWLGRLQQLAHANADATTAAVSRALRVDQALAAAGDVDAALRVQHEWAWLSSHKRG